MVGEDVRLVRKEGRLVGDDVGLDWEDAWLVAKDVGLVGEDVGFSWGGCLDLG